MHYLLVAYANNLDTLNASEREGLAAACQASTAALMANGSILAVAEVQNNDHIVTLQANQGRVSVNIGPLHQDREQAIELFLVAARDLNEVIQIATYMPQARRGPIEVRPLVTSEATMTELRSARLSDYPMES